MVDRDGNKENQERPTEPSGQSTEPCQVLRLQERSTTELVTRLRVLLHVMDTMTLDKRDLIVNLFQLKLFFQELDAKMSNGAGMPEQWIMNHIDESLENW